MNSPQTSRGIVLVSTRPKAGKTAACAGLSACLIQGGFQVQAIKPFLFYGLDQPIPEENLDQRFIDSVVRPLSPPETLVIPGAQDLSPLLWKRMIEQLSSLPYPAFIESQGSMATPLRYPVETAHGPSHSIIDAVDLARLLKFSILIVTPKTDHLYAELAPAFSYLLQRHEHPIGWLAVGLTTQSEHISDWDQQCMMISQDYQTTYIGEIPYCETINIKALKPGDLVEQCGMGLDLFPIQQALQLAFI